MTKNSVGVIGFGKTGRALLDFLIPKKEFKKIGLYDDNPIKETRLRRQYEAEGVTFHIGEKNFPQIEEMDFLVISPGVNGRESRFHRFRREGKPILSEIEFASRYLEAKIIAVTGTNGKSTTVSLIHHILENCGRKSLLAGNIGTPLIAEIDRVQDDSVVVLEVSSFQLEEIVDFRPHIALLLNMTPDHLDRYPTIEDYYSAKLNLFKNQEPHDFMVLNHDLLSTGGIAIEEAPARAGKTWFSTRRRLARGAFAVGQFLHLDFIKDNEKISLQKNPLQGPHNLENLLAAVTAARLAGVEPPDIERSIVNFKGLPHRMESVGKIDGVEFIDDSKATNVEAAAKSIGSFREKVIPILGGKDKGGDFSILEKPLEEHASRVLLLGDAAEKIFRQMPAIKEKFEFVADLKEAVNRGYTLLKKNGGVVLLAPGCASFDMFDNFEHRGNVFKEEFRELKREKQDG